jgi:anti-sigma factor RsiW
MMTCREALPWIQLYIDGELASSDVAEVERHLGECLSCHTAFQHLRHVSDNIRAAMPLYEPAAESEARVREMVRIADRHRNWRRYAGILALAAALIVTLWLSGPPEDQFIDFAAGSHIRHANGTARWMSFRANRASSPAGWRTVCLSTSSCRSIRPNMSDRRAKPNDIHLREPGFCSSAIPT